jgi:hypothetical protein
MEDNVYLNDDLVICRFHKLVVVFFKSQNIFTFYLLKRSKESNVSTSMMNLLNAENPAPILEKLVGTKSPDPLSCSVEGYEVKLIPQSFGNYDVLITFETQQSMITKNIDETISCIVHLSDFGDINPIQLFHVISSSNSPNTYAKKDLIIRYKDVYEDIPTHNILLMTMNTLLKNIKFISNRRHDITIHLVSKETYFRPSFPAINFTVLYLDEDRQLVEPLLPSINSHTPHFVVKKLQSFEGYF